MTKEEILAQWDGMTPRERDALVAEKVMGWKVQFMVEDSWGWMYTEPDRNLWNNIPHFSTNMSATMEVADKMHSMDNERYALALEYYPEEKEWGADFDESSVSSQAISKTAAEAICKAALLVCMEVE